MHANVGGLNTWKIGKCFKVKYFGVLNSETMKHQNVTLLEHGSSVHHIY